MIFDKGVKTTRGRTFFSKNHAVTIKHQYAKIMYLPIPYTNFTLKYIIGINVNGNTVKNFARKRRRNLCDLELGQEFLDTTSKSQSIKKKY